MKCPKCFALLQQIEIYNETYVHSCPKCFGAFYTESELAVPINLDGAKPGKWPCPSCEGAMETGTVCNGQIELDHCTECDGFWFDAGELESLSKLSGVERVTKPVGAIGDFEDSQTSSEPDAVGPVPFEKESIWHEALRFLIKSPDSK